MQVSSGIAYFGNESNQGTLRDRVQNAIDCDISSIQIKMSDIKSFEDFEGYNGEITCYLDDVKWDKTYFDELSLKLEKLKLLGLSSIIIDTMMSVNKYKSMNHEEKMNSLKDMSSYIVNIGNKGIRVGLLNNGSGVFVGTVIMPIIYNLYPELSDKIGYAVNIDEKSDGGISELDFNSVNTVNITPVVENGNLVYDRSRSLIGNVYSEFVKFGHVPNIFAVANNMSLPVINNLSSLCQNIINLVVTKIGGVTNGRTMTKSMPGYHNTGVNDNAGTVRKAQNNYGFVNCLEMFLVLVIIGLVGVAIATVLVLL